MGPFRASGWDGRSGALRIAAEACGCGGSAEQLEVAAARFQDAVAGGCAVEPDYDMARIWDVDEDIRSLKSLALFGLRGVAAYAYHARVLGRTDETVDAFFVEALAALAEEGSMDSLVPLVLKVGEVNLVCMGMLDEANTEAYGTPEPAEVTLEVESGPFIVITGHDLHDLKQLLEQTEGCGVNVYTHGEMLLAHAYPELKKYPHLKGSFGTAWQNQQKEFADLSAPVLFITNCLMPPRDSYADRVFATGPVAYPEIARIGEEKDFTPVIERAIQLGGYAETQRFTGINGGSKVMTGFAQGTVLGVADTVVDAGSRPGRAAGIAPPPRRAPKRRHSETGRRVHLPSASLRMSSVVGHRAKL